MRGTVLAMHRISPSFITTPEAQYRDGQQGVGYRTQTEMSLNTLSDYW